MGARVTTLARTNARTRVGEDDWGFSLALNGSMDANVDPWFKVNQVAKLQKPYFDTYACSRAHTHTDTLL